MPQNNTGEPQSTVSENLRTLKVEYLSADYQPARMQTLEGIQRLTRGLAPFRLTKTEKLQIMDQAPVASVKLYVIVEKLEDRLGEQMEEVLGSLWSSLSAPAASTAGTSTHGPSEIIAETRLGDQGADGLGSGRGADNVEFVDTGEGVEIEGDLDVDDD
ncbi:hypothetical protein BC834DRAFT_974785 [Gloeopeniophorella convolvens]|nr:hypothetical protein BC834DRAFT_974785 [Gloeopeniophorella convolvens]